MSSKAEIRHFLYLDDDLVAEFLAQLEEGELSDYRYETLNENSAAGSGGVRVPFIAASIDAGVSAHERFSYSMRLSPPSQFERMTRLLRSSGLLVDDPTDLSIASPRSIAAVDAAVSLSGMTRMALGFQELERANRLFGVMNQQQPAQAPSGLWFLPEGLRRRVEHRMEGSKWRRFNRFAHEMEGRYVAVIVRTMDQPSTSILCKLDRKKLRVPPAQLEGRARLVVKIIRGVGADEVVEASDLFPGAPSLTASFRQGIEASAASTVIGEMAVRAPAVIATTVAIYR